MSPTHATVRPLKLLGNYRSILIATALATTSAANAATAIDISGDHENPNEEFGQTASYTLTADSKFGWRTSRIEGDIDLNGHSFVLDTGGGNQTAIIGSISGMGTFEWIGGDVPQVRPSVLGGPKPNSFKGIFTLSKGVLDLDKPEGTDAISGDLVLGTKGSAMLRILRSEQISNDSNLTLTGSGINSLDLGGNTETIGSWVIHSQAVIQLSEKPSRLISGNSSGKKWDLSKTLMIFNFKPGQDFISFGSDDSGLTPEQLARIGFDKPAGLPAGLYSAKITNRGEVIPDRTVEAINPPFDLSPEAAKARAKLYEIAGLDHLTNARSPLKDGMTIDFFGDSLTWLNSYIEYIHQALKVGQGTKNLDIKTLNHGINGGGVLTLRDGSPNAGYPGDSAQKPFNDLIVSDKADIAVVFIGINDVWWRETPPEIFEKALTDMMIAAKKQHVIPLLVTMTVNGELPDGSNPDDKKIESYCEITRKVSAATDVTLVDLRKAYVAYLQNHNTQLRVDGSLFSEAKGLLTYDAVHPTARGAELIANLISDGIRRALERRY